MSDVLPPNDHVDAGITGAPSSNRVIFWDFDGTLGYREGGWTGALHQLLMEANPSCEVAGVDIRSFSQEGFPWHTPEVAHRELGDALVGIAALGHASTDSG